MTGDYHVQELALEPGDRLVFLTDGMLERNASDVDVGSIMTARQHLHPREAVQELTQEVVRACGGKLLDDASVLCVDWHGDAGEDAAAGS
jgi:serine phosphatase RsbU (regulator of sigma subunit)